MDPSPDPIEREIETIHQEILRILRMHKRWSRLAELIVGVITGFQDIAGRSQDAGEDRPFDLRSDDDRIRIDVKTQDGGELDVKKEKVGKQYQAWVTAGRCFVPVQVVLDRMTRGWYVVAGIPTASRTPLDPLDTEFDPANPGRPFCIGKCLRGELRDRQRFAQMAVKLKKALKEVRENGEVVQAQLEREHRAWVAQVAEHVLADGVMQEAVVQSIGSSDQAMSNLARSDEAMMRLAQSKEAMTRLAQSDQAIANLAQSDEAMTRLAQSNEAMTRLAQSKEAMTRLAQSDQAISNLAQSDEAMNRLAQSDEAMTRLAQSDEAMARLAQSEEAMRKLLAPEVFEIWRALQNKPKT